MMINVHYYIGERLKFNVIINNKLKVIRLPRIIGDLVMTLAGM